MKEMGADHKNLASQEQRKAIWKYHNEDGDLLELISATISGWSSIEENEKRIEMGAGQVKENDHAEKGRSTTIWMVIS